MCILFKNLGKRLFFIVCMNYWLTKWQFLAILGPICQGGSSKEPWPLCDVGSSVHEFATAHKGCYGAVRKISSSIRNP